MIGWLKDPVHFVFALIVLALIGLVVWHLILSKVEKRLEYLAEDLQDNLSNGRNIELKKVSDKEFQLYGYKDARELNVHITLRRRGTDLVLEVTIAGWTDETVLKPQQDVAAAQAAIQLSIDKHVVLEAGKRSEDSPH